MFMIFQAWLKSINTLNSNIEDHVKEDRAHETFELMEGFFMYGNKLCMAKDLCEKVFMGLIKHSMWGKGGFQ